MAIACRWLAVMLGVGAAVAVAIVGPPAGASTAVSAQLSLSGIVTAKSPLGGSVIGIHPGDSINLQGASAGVSVQGLSQLGVPLGDVLGDLLGKVVGFQYVLHLPATFPGGRRDVQIGPCGGRAGLSVAFPNLGSYDFTWTAYAVTVLPVVGTCQLNTLNLDGNQLARAGITLNGSNQYIGKVVVATDPPPGGLTVQLPGVGVRPSLPGAGQLPGATLPGGTLPTVPVSPPSLSQPVPGSSSAETGSPGSPDELNYTPPGESIEDRVVPKGYGCCDEDGHSPDSVLNSVPGNGQDGGTGAGAHRTLAASDARAASAARQAHAGSGRATGVGAGEAPAGQLLLLLAIAAILALSVVTAAYARLRLVRTDAGPEHQAR